MINTLMLVTNDVSHDTRVKKVANSIAQKSDYSVSIIGISNITDVERRDLDGLDLIVVPYKKYTYEFFFRKKLKRLHQIADDISSLTEQEKELAPKRKKLKKLLLTGHDALVSELPYKKSIVEKLILLVKQFLIIKRAEVRVGKASKRIKGRINKLKRERAKTKRKLKKQVPFFDEYVRPIGRHLDYYKSLYPFIDQFDPKIIHAHDLYTLLSAVRFKLKSKKPVKVIYDAHELEMHRNKAYNFVRNISDQIFEWYGIRRADAVITVSDGISEVISMAYGLPRPQVILNSPNKMIVSERSTKNIRTLIGAKDDDVIVVYVGVVTFGRGLELLVKSLMHMPVNFHVAILGPRRESRDKALQDLAELKGISGRLHLLDPVSPAEVPLVIGGADLFINPAQNVSKSYDLALPNKLFDAVFARLPIVVGNLSEMKNFVEDHQIGIARENTDHKKIATAIKEAYQARNTFRLDPESTNKILDSYCWEAQAEKLSEVYSSVLKSAQR